ncbi:MAG TPA: molybdate ABC transporter substrate-binding protein [Capsulimonadaceae bacterium]|jgi:molybdate transport system substrate-binding protein
MSFKTSIRLLILALAVLLPTVNATASPIRVFAAASLTEAFRDIGVAYESKHPGDKVEFNFAGSPTLKTQIQQGAPVDVFASADLPNMQALVDAKVVNAPVVFTRNTLVIVTPPKDAAVKSPADLAKSGVKLVLAGQKVPAGHYADEVLTKMTPALGADFAEKTRQNTVSRESNVKAVLAKCILGEADAGIVFSTDARSAGRTVRVITIPTEYNVVAEYPIATITNADNRSGAASFVAFVLSKPGQAILKKYGFLK